MTDGDVHVVFWQAATATQAAPAAVAAAPAPPSSVSVSERERSRDIQSSERTEQSKSERERERERRRASAVRNIYHLTVSLKYTFRPPTRSSCCAALAKIPTLTHTNTAESQQAADREQQAPDRGSGSIDRDRSQAKDSATQTQCAMFLCMPSHFVCV